MRAGHEPGTQDGCRARCREHINLKPWALMRPPQRRGAKKEERNYNLQWVFYRKRMKGDRQKRKVNTGARGARCKNNQVCDVTEATGARCIRKTGGHNWAQIHWKATKDQDSKWPLGLAIWRSPWPTQKQLQRTGLLKSAEEVGVGGGWWGKKTHDADINSVDFSVEENPERQ